MVNCNKHPSTVATFTANNLELGNSTHFPPTPIIILNIGRHERWRVCWYDTKARCWLISLIFSIPLSDIRTPYPIWTRYPIFRALTLITWGSNGPSWPNHMQKVIKMLPLNYYVIRRFKENEMKNYTRFM